MTTKALFYVATTLQALAVVYALVLMARGGARAAWLWLIGAMLSMLTWRVVHMLGVQPAAFFNPLIAIWGSTCLFFGMALFGKEVSRRARAEAERDALLGSERAAREQAERASRIKDEFLATLSHELRTPLTAILGWCHLLRESADQPGGRDEAAQAVETIERNARTQARLIEDLLDMTRITGGTLRLDRQVIDPAEAVRAALQALRPAADEKRLKVEACLGEGLRVAADPLRLQQVAWNLLSNAVKFTPTGGAVRVRLRRSATSPGSVELEVSDTGEGINADFMPHVFTRFRQSDGTDARRHGGLGLGLSIVKSLVELHGGSVRAASDGPGRGTTFVVSLPTAADFVPAPSTSHAPGDDGTARPSARLKGVRVLVVDDDPDARGIVRRVLERQGADVRAVASADEALALLGDGTGLPDVLISDISMPGQDGYAMMRRLRSLPAARGGTVPAVALTAHARGEDRGRALDSGFQFHVAKPINAAELTDVVRRAATNGVLA